MNSRHRMMWCAALAAAMCVIITGCSFVPDGESGEASSQDQNSDMPEFSGPYAAELRDEFEKAPEGFVREALRDGEVTDGERAEAIQRFGECLTGAGYGLAKYNENDGSFDVDMPNEADTDAARLSSQKVVQDCQVSSGMSSVDYLYFMMHSNPEHRDVGELMVECLLRERVVPPSYTVADFHREYPLGQVTLLPKDPRWGVKDPVMMCQNDPLNLMGTFNAFHTE